MGDARVYELSYTMTLDDWERGISTWQKASGQARKSRLNGALLTVLGAVPFVVVFTSSFSLVVGLVLILAPSAAIATGWALLTGSAGRAARSKYFAANPSLLRPCRLVVQESGLSSWSDIAGQQFAWTFWGASIELDDMIVLSTGVTTTATWAVIPPRGLGDPADWDGLVAFVEARVAPHPRAPGRTKVRAG